MTKFNKQSETKIASLFIITLTAVAVATPAAHAALTGYWAFDGDYSDDSGNGHTATPHGDATLVGGGKFGGAVSLDGNGDWVDIADSVDHEFPQGTDFSLTLFYNGPNSDNNNGLLTKGYANNPRDSNGYYLMQVTNPDQFEFDSRCCAGSTPRVRSGKIGPDITDGDWHNVTVVRDYGANQLRAYVDGGLGWTKTMGAPLVDGNWNMGVNTEALTIGDHLDRFTTGSFDDVAVFKGQVLSQPDIAFINDNGVAAFLAGPPPPPPPPADLQVDIGRSEDPLLQSGWQEWNFTGSSGILNQSQSFAYAGATDDTLDATLSTTTSGQGRNYGTDNVTDPGNLAIQEVWADQAFFNNNVSGSMTLTLDDLEAGTYSFNSYHYADNLSDGGGTNDEGTASVFVNGVDTTLDVTFISGILSNVSGGGNPSAADLDTFGTLSLQFTVPNNGDTVSILFDNLTGGDTFGLNGFELHLLSPNVIPEPSTFLIWSLGLLGLAWYARRRRTK